MFIISLRTLYKSVPFRKKHERYQSLNTLYVTNNMFNLKKKSYSIH